jgi:hypothetical protein
MRARAWFPNVDRAELRAMLGIDAEERCRTELLPGSLMGKRWQAYTVDVFGVELSDGETAASGRTLELGARRLDVRQQAIALEGTSAVLAWQWRDGQADIVMTGLLDADPRAAGRLLAGLPLLRQVPKGREPRLTYSEEELVVRVHEASREIWRTGRRPTYLNVAAHTRIRLSEGRLKAHVKDYGLDWLHLTARR